MFSSEPGEVYGLLGESLYIPCVTLNEHSIVEWRRVLGNGDDGPIIADTLVGDVNYPQYTFDAGNTPRRNFTIQIKSVEQDETQLKCRVFGAGIGASGLSATSVITVIGKY